MVAVGVLAAGAGAGVLLDAGVAAVRRWRQSPPGGRSPADLLTGLSAGAAGLLLAWLALAALLALLTLAGGELGRRVSPVAAMLAPTALRAAVVAVVGGSLAVSAGLTTPTAGPSRSASVSHLGSPSPSPASAPSRPAPAAAASSPSPHRPGPAPVTDRADVGLVTSRPAPGRHPDPEVVVRPGDTLWSITARHLGPDATAVQVAREWPRWFAANRATIGTDPDRLQPGQRLVPPR